MAATSSFQGALCTSFVPTALVVSSCAPTDSHSPSAGSRTGSRKHADLSGQRQATERRRLMSPRIQASPTARPEVLVRGTHINNALWLLIGTLETVQNGASVYPRTRRGVGSVCLATRVRHRRLRTRRRVVIARWYRALRRNAGSGDVCACASRERGRGTVPWSSRLRVDFHDCDGSEASATSACASTPPCCHMTPMGWRSSKGVRWSSRVVSNVWACPCDWWR